jgi:ornithine carbamoyltransferase
MTLAPTVSHAPAHPGSLLKESDLTAEDFFRLVRLAVDLKAAKAAGRERPRLRGRNIALLFQKASTRTRCAFEVAAYDQGAHVTYLGPEGSHFGREESVADTAAVLGQFFDGIEFRGYAQDTVEELARNAGVPVWNGLTDQWHPTQMLADILTMREVHGPDTSTLRYCFTGDGRGNIARSLLVTGALLGADVRIAAPTQLQPPGDVVATAERLAANSGASIEVTADLRRAVADCEFVYTDVWVSMGEPDAEWDRRVPLLTAYQVTPEVMAATGRPDSRFMHCLPAIHSTDTTVGRRLHDRYQLLSAEVTHEVFTSRASLVFAQAQNRMHTIKAVMVAALGD